MIHVLPVSPRPEGYNPLAVKRVTPERVARLGKSGEDCYAAIVNRNVAALGKSMNECMECWETILPNTVTHKTITVDLKGILEYYQANYHGAMYSGCGGGYLYVVSDRPVPGGNPAR